MSISVEIYPAILGNGIAQNAFIGRIPNLDVATEREAAMRRLAAAHAQARSDLGFDYMSFITAEQVHGDGIAVVGETTSPTQVAGVDALITNQLDICLGIYVADCCAVYVLDTGTSSIGLAHSGKKGTELEILPKMLRKMGEAFGTQPENTIVQLSPCIRPPHYEIDFAAEIIAQAERMGVGEVVDTGCCTASDHERYYSYRREKGKTGRMLALFGLTARF